MVSPSFCQPLPEVPYPGADDTPNGAYAKSNQQQAGKLSVCNMNVRKHQANIQKELKTRQNS